MKDLMLIDDRLHDLRRKGINGNKQKVPTWWRKMVFKQLRRNQTPKKKNWKRSPVIACR